MTEPLMIDRSNSYPLQEVLVLSGPLTASNEAIFQNAMRREDPADTVILDLSDLAFVDTVGVRAILKCRQIFEETECGFWLMGARAPVRRTLARCGVLDVLPLRD